jgi:hypothetical protein
VTKVVERFVSGFDADAPAHIVAERDAAVAAGAGIAQPGHVFPRATATVDETRGDQRLERSAIRGVAFALSRRNHVRRKTKPREILEDRCLVFRPAALAIVIFDAKQHAATGRSRHAPDIQRVHHVTKMQIPSRGGANLVSMKRRQCG